MLYNVCFSKEFAKIAASLHEARSLKRSNEQDDGMDTAFSILKRMLCKPPILTKSNINKPFMVETDVWCFAVGDTLSQNMTKDNHA